MAARHFPGELALGADTVVALGDQALGKPTSPNEAVAMLRRLRGRTHQVITAVSLARVGAPEAPPTVWERSSITEVWMREYTDADMEAYVATGDPLDKAGSYAIQDADFHPVERIQGCFLTVVGLPLPEVLELLGESGRPVPAVERGRLEAICPACRDLRRLDLAASLGRQTKPST